MHTPGVLGQVIPVWHMAKVRRFADFSLSAFAFCVTITVVFLVFHQLNYVIYVVPAESERSLMGDGREEEADDLQK